MALMTDWKSPLRISCHLTPSRKRSGTGIIMTKTTKRQDTLSAKTSKKATSKQIAAIVGIVLLVLLYIVTLVAAFLDNSATGTLFMLCLSATIVIPILIWIYTWMYGKLTGRHTFADPDLNLSAESSQNPINTNEGTDK